MDVLRIRRMHQFQFLQPAHPVGPFGAQQVALPGMHSQDFPRRRNLKTLGGAAMRLQLELLYLFFCHQHYLAIIWGAALLEALQNLVRALLNSRQDHRI